MPRVKGKGPILKANFVGKGKSKKNFADLSSTNNLMLLSIVGNEHCEGEYLEAALNYSLKHHHSTTLLIADEVYWHNLKPLSTDNGPLSQEKIHALKQEALVLGTKFFEGNLKHFLAPLHISVESFNEKHADKSTIEKIALINLLARRAGLNYQIAGWQEWINMRPEFKHNQVDIMQLYKTDNRLRENLEKAAHEFAKRHEQEGGYDLWFHRAVGYLTEESPTVMLIAAALGYNFVTYPGDMPEIFQATKDYFVVPSSVDPCKCPPFAILAEHPNLLVNWMQTYFKRENPKPKTTAITSYSAQFFAPKSDKYPNTAVATALSEAMMGAMPVTSEPKRIEHVVHDLSGLLFSLNNKERKNLLDLIMKISLVVDIVQDYQGQPEASPPPVELVVASQPPIDVRQSNPGLNKIPFITSASMAISDKRELHLEEQEEQSSASRALRRS